MQTMTSLDYITQGIDDERLGRAQAAYSLWEVYRCIPEHDERIALLNEVSSLRNITPERLEKWLQIPERIPLDVLEDRFERTADGEQTWHLGLTWTHLEKAAQAGGKRYSSEERVEWLCFAADQEMSSGEFTDWLREHGIIKSPSRKSKWTEVDGEREADFLINLQTATAMVKDALAGAKGDRAKAKAQKFWTKSQDKLTAPMEKPTTACQLLERMADELRKQGIDVDLSRVMANRKGRPINAVALLEFLMGEFKREHPNAEFTLQT